MRIAVLGAGIAGLAAAWRLGRQHEVTLFEAGSRAGGNIRTEEFHGCRIEWGPDGFLDNEPRTLDLVRDLGLTGRLCRARTSRRFLWRAGKLRELPSGPKAFLASDSLPLLGRLRALLEPFARDAPEGDESVHAFAARRLGHRVADLLVDAFVSGVFAGDAKRLSVKSAFPRLKALEARHGSLIRGARGQGFGPKGTLTSFDGGMQVLTDTIAGRVDLRCDSPVPRLERGDYDRVVCTIPAPRAAALCDGALARALASIPTAPVAVVATLVPGPLDIADGFGFLAPRGEGLRILGTLYESSIFDGRAPDGLRLFRTMVGGRHDPEAVALPDDALKAIVEGDLGRAWGRFPEPVAWRIIRHPLGIAQYEIGHEARVAAAEAACPEWLRLAGSSYRGVSLNGCIKEALDWTP